MDGYPPTYLLVRLPTDNPRVRQRYFIILGRAPNGALLAPGRVARRYYSIRHARLIANRCEQLAAHLDHLREQYCRAEMHLLALLYEPGAEHTLPHSSM